MNRIRYSFFRLINGGSMFAHEAHRAGREEDGMNDFVSAGKADGNPDKSILFSTEVLDDFRLNVGRYPAETGGMLACTADPARIDLCHFDSQSANSSSSFYYDVESMTRVYHNWDENGCITNGIYHSHPCGAIRPSFHDISTALIHIRFFELDYFYLPIFQSAPNGFYTMYFYVVRLQENHLSVTLQYVLQATMKGYQYRPFAEWKKLYSIKALDNYRSRIDNEQPVEEIRQEAVSAADRETNPKTSRTAWIMELEDIPVPEAPAASGTPDVPVSETPAASGTPDASVSETPAASGTPDVPNVPEIPDYFTKISALYPERVLKKKVIVCIGTGGARSALENLARNGFRNFILIDADVVSPSNIATQGVFISEMGRKKVEVLRDRICDINPCAEVICVDRFLDNDMSDEEFHSFMIRFQDRKPEDYLILGCTDNFQAQKRSSILALKYGTPYLAAMMYKGGAAAELIFLYPGVTESCPRCLLRSRFEMYENGYINDVDSSACTIFATERMNALKGYLALMLLMYHEDPASPFSNMLDQVHDRNFVTIRLDPQLQDSMGIPLFDQVLQGAKDYTYMDETLWIPQLPDNAENSTAPCTLCGGLGDLTKLYMSWPDTRLV